MPDDKQLTDLSAWALAEMLESHPVSESQIQHRGQRPRLVINHLRYAERVPVRTHRRVNCPPNPHDKRATSWDMTTEEITRFKRDRLGQIADMAKQAADRQHRNECRKAKQLFQRLGLDVPAEIEAGAALIIPHVSEGKSN